TSGARTDGLLNISFEGFMDIAITIPTLPEQQKIGALFRRLDRLITLHKRKLLEKYNKNNTKFLQNVTHQQSVLKLCCITFNPIIERTS
ncbi:restriction endonuclease subunit S, partial [Avibacterium paragallinarum]